MNPTINPADVFGRGFCISTAPGKLPFGDDVRDGDDTDRGAGGEVDIGCDVTTEPPPGDGIESIGAGGEANIGGDVTSELPAGDGAETTGAGELLGAVIGSGREVDGVSWGGVLGFSVAWGGGGVAGEGERSGGGEKGRFGVNEVLLFGGGDVGIISGVGGGEVTTGGGSGVGGTSGGGEAVAAGEGGGGSGMVGGGGDTTGGSGLWAAGEISGGSNGVIEDGVGGDGGNGEGNGVVIWGGGDGGRGCRVAGDRAGNIGSGDSEDILEWNLVCWISNVVENGRSGC